MSRRRNDPIVYSEVDTYFRLNNANELILSVNSDAVADSLRNIIRTHPGERVMNCNFGTRLRELLFEPLDSETAVAIGEEIRQSVEEEDPRIQIVRIYVTPNHEEQRYNVTVEYYIKQLPQNLNRTTLGLAGIID